MLVATWLVQRQSSEPERSGRVRKGQQEFLEEVVSREWFGILVRPGRKATSTNSWQRRASSGAPGGRQRKRSRW